MSLQHQAICSLLASALSPWLPQECKISGGAGFSKSWVHGGNAYSIPLKTISIGYEP